MRKKTIMRKKTRKLLKSGALLKPVTLGKYPHTQRSIVNTNEEIKKVKKQIAREEQEFEKQLKKDERELRKNNPNPNPNPKQNIMGRLFNAVRRTRKLPKKESPPIQYKSHFKEKSSSSSTKKLRRSLEKNNRRLEEMGIDPERLRSFTIDSNHPRGFRVEYR